MSNWQQTELGTARRSTQQRFRIYLEQLDFFSEEFRSACSNTDLEDYLTNENGFAKELLNTLGDHLSIADLRQIVDVFQEELFSRERKRFNYNLERMEAALESGAVSLEEARKMREEGK